MIRPEDIKVTEEIIFAKPCLIARIQLAEAHFAEELRALYGDDHEAKITLIKQLLWRRVYGEAAGHAASLREMIRFNDPAQTSEAFGRIDDLCALLEYPT